MTTTTPPTLPPITPLPLAAGDAHAILQAEVSIAERAALELIAHSSKAGTGTSEFWVQFVAPLVSFLLATVGSFLVAHDTSAAQVWQAVVPPAAGTITAAASAFLAREYVAGRAALKRDWATAAHRLLTTGQ